MVYLILLTASLLYLIESGILAAERLVLLGAKPIGAKPITRGMVNLWLMVTASAKQPLGRYIRQRNPNLWRQTRRLYQRRRTT
jgi:hypothetical protein